MGWGHPCMSLSQWHGAHCLYLSLAPFGVKQEQLSPRGQAGPPESLGVPTAQETSVLRGEAMVDGHVACGLPCGCPFGPWRVGAGMERSSQNLPRNASSPRPRKTLQSRLPLHSGSGGPSALRFRRGVTGRQECSRGGSRAWGLWRGHRHPSAPHVSHVFQGHPWARFQAEASARASPAHGCLPRVPSPTVVPSLT